MTDNPKPTRVRLREWSREPAQGSTFLTGVTLPDDAHTQALLQRLDAQNKLRVVEYRHGLVIETTSFVGRIKLGSLEITVEPKLAGLPLLRLLRYAYGLRQLDLLTEADFGLTAYTFQDLLIQELAREVEALMARGLRREYVRREEPLGALRGRIDMGRLVRTGGMASATLPCVFHERREDALLNQVLRAGLVLGARTTTDPTLRGRLGRLNGFMGETVSAMRLSSHGLQYARHSLTRLTAAYQPALTLIELLWENQGLTLEDEAGRVELPGFLFDMNRFFQALLSRFLRENLSGYRLEDEHRLRGVFAFAPNFNPRGQRAPNPRPDYVLWQGTRLAAVLDAKYRDLWTTPLPPEWLYQLAIYAVSQAETRTATILYPHVGATAREARIDVQDPVRGVASAQVILQPVDVLELDAVLCAGGGAAASARHALASMLALHNPSERVQNQ